MSLLGDLVLIFAIALVVVPLLHRLKIPSIAGFIAAGILVGPGVLGLVHSAHEVELLAEVGVVLLLFGIGMELSLERLRRLWKPVLVGGLLQVALTLGIATVVAMLFGAAWRPAVFVGCLVAVSSTAIVLRGLESRGEIDAPHGRLTLGILVFQDLSVVPMMLAIPLLAGDGVEPSTLLLTSLKAAAVLVGVVVLARLVVPRALHLIARTRQRDLFILGVFLVCVGTAYVVSLAGISLALGAFLAGLVVADSDYRHQALAELIPFREVLTSLFFFSVGMLLDPSALLKDGPVVLGLVGAVIVGKFAVVVLVGQIMGLPLRVSILAGAALAQIGEFSFVLSREAAEVGLLSGDLGTWLPAVTILTMLLTPLGLAIGPHIAAGAGRVRWLTGLMGVKSAAEEAEGEKHWHDHIIVAGYGVVGINLIDALRKEGSSYILVDLNPKNVRLASAAGHPAVFGDVTSPEVLEHLNLEQATDLVLVINDPRAVERAVRTARSLAPNLRIFTRTRYAAEVDALKSAGADVVVAEEVEAGAKLARLVMGRQRGKTEENP